MNINAFNAASAYGAARKALRPDGSTSSTANTKTEFHPEKILTEMTGAIAKSESAASAFMVGKADPHSVVEAMASAELAVETAVTLRNRVVEAYQELMRMPI